MEEKVFLGRDAILAIPDLQTEDVWVPEWNTWVRVKSMTAAERDAFEQSIFATRGTDAAANYQNLRARLVVLVAVNGDGRRMFSDDDAGALGQKSVTAVDRLFEVAQRLNALGPKEVRDLVGNSGPGQRAGTPSG